MRARVVSGLAVVGLVAGCGTNAAPARPPPPPAVTTPAPDARTATTDAGPATTTVDAAVTAAATEPLTGDQLAPFVPVALGGVPRHTLGVKAYGVLGSFKLGTDPAVLDDYYGVDISSTFEHGQLDSVETNRAAMCPHFEVLTGARACVWAGSRGGYFAHWHLANRLVVDLSAPDEATLRAWAAELRIADIARRAATP